VNRNAGESGVPIRNVGDMTISLLTTTLITYDVAMAVLRTRLWPTDDSLPSAKLFRLIYELPLHKTLIVLCVMAPLEELIFRVGLIGGMSRLGGPTALWVAFSSLFFGALHASNSQKHPIFLALHQAGAGAIFAAIYLVGGFWIAAAVHLGFNLTIMSLVRLAKTVSPEEIDELRRLVYAEE
jgi:membrane protease YdiL (CAAX protease family)